MKNMFLILTFSLMSLGCSNNNDDPQNNILPELIGKWKIVERYSTDGGSPASWSPYDSGEIYDKWFKSDGTFIIVGINNPDCASGTYSVENNYITYTDSPCAPEKPVIIESLTHTELIIDANFFEPIKTKYIKVIE